MDTEPRVTAAFGNVFSPTLFLARWLEGNDSEFGLAQSLEKGEVASLRAAFEASSVDRQSALLRRWGRSSLEEFFSLSEALNPSDFLDGFFHFAIDQERAGNLESARGVYTAIRSFDPKFMPGDFPELSRRADHRLRVLSGGGHFGERAELWLRSLTADGIADGVNRSGAVLGFATILCSYVRPLRPLAAAGIGLLSNSIVAGTLLAAGGYTLYRQAPEAIAVGGRLWSSGYLGTDYNRFEDGLSLSGYLVGALGTGIGLSSFVLGARVYGVTREAALLKGYKPGQVKSVAYRQADSVRRAVQDPEIWIQFARSRPNLSSWQREFMVRGARWANRSLLYGSALIGAGKFGLGLQHYHDGAPQNAAQQSDLTSLLLGLAIDVSPAMTLHLYRSGRGNRNFDLGPPLSQELTERHYQDPILRKIVLQRLDRGVPPLSPAAERAFIRQGNVDLSWVESALREAQQVAPLTRNDVQPRWELSETPLPKVPPLPEPVVFSEGARWLQAEQVAELEQFDLPSLRESFSKGEISPVGVLGVLLEHPEVRDGALFPRELHRGPFRRQLFRFAERSQKRFENGTARPLEGVLVGVKDLVPGIDGKMQLGSKTSLVTGVGANPTVSALLDLGAIPVPVGMVAAANGGSGRDAAFGYIPHPVRKGMDPAGSSSAPAYVVGRRSIPILVAIVSTTGGSIAAPAGAVGLPSFSPPVGAISTKNMVPFATFLDRIGVLGRSSRDTMTVARLLSGVTGDDPHLRLQNPGALYQINPRPPAILYLESLVAQASKESRTHFFKTMESYRTCGYEVTPLGSAWDFLAEVPFRLYPFDAYVAGAFTHTNPLQRHFFEPPRRTLDENLLVRLPKAAISLKLKFYDQARRLSQLFEGLVKGKLGDGVVLASPSAEAIPTADLMAGKAGARLDGHDRITMAHNRIPDWGQINQPSAERPEVGVVFTGPLPNLMHFTGEFQPHLVLSHTQPERHALRVVPRPPNPLPREVTPLPIRRSTAETSSRRGSS